jgi:hypothetical protein
VLASMNELSNEVRSYVLQSTQWQRELMQSRLPPQRPLLTQEHTVAAVATFPPVNNQSQATTRPFQGIRTEDDDWTQTGVSICGHCNYRGHDRATCKRKYIICNACTLPLHWLLLRVMVPSPPIPPTQVELIPSERGQVCPRCCARCAVAGGPCLAESAANLVILG